MKLNDQLFKDVSRLASGAASALSGLKEQFDAHRPSATGSAGAVSREEFEAVAAMAVKAREVQDELIKRIMALEARIGDGASPATEPAQTTQGSNI